MADFCSIHTYSNCHDGSYQFGSEKDKQYHAIPNFEKAGDSHMVVVLKAPETRHYININNYFIDNQPRETLKKKSKLLHILWTTILLIWVLALVLICDMEHFGTIAFLVQKSPSYKEVMVPTQLKIVVFYEALCPDSKDFVSRELKPVYHSMKDSIALSLVPYGKAQSRILEDGTYSFTCQHGEIECLANIVHACVTKYVTDTSKSLDIVSCMIDVNLRSRNPLHDGEKCVGQFGEKWTPMENCSTGKEGKEIMFHMGRMTHDLNPPVTFIPTITINGKRDNQNLILRDFKKAVCNSLSGSNQAPDTCNSL